MALKKLSKIFKAHLMKNILESNIKEEKYARIPYRSCMHFTINFVRYYPK